MPVPQVPLDRSGKPLKDYSEFLCSEAGQSACPVRQKEIIAGVSVMPILDGLGDWFKVGFECLGEGGEIDSCGGCVSLGQG